MTMSDCQDFEAMHYGMADRKGLQEDRDMIQKNDSADLELSVSSRDEYVREVRKTFWDSRAGMGLEAGTKDILLKQLEMDAIASYVSDDMDVLDVGCGNGMTAVELASRHNIRITGIDYSAPMITAASELSASEYLGGSTIRFLQGDMERLPVTLGKYDLIYTERSLINLDDWTGQAAAITNIGNLLRDGGLFVMCECSRDGLDKINIFRRSSGLPAIKPPWHDCYLHDRMIAELHIPWLELKLVNDFSSTYYLLSRVVNAYFAAQEGKEPDSQSPINKLAMVLPPMGDMRQTKIWVWRKI